MRTRLLIRSKLAGEEGFEPGLHGPKGLLDNILYIVQFRLVPLYNERASLNLLPNYYPNILPFPTDKSLYIGSGNANETIPPLALPTLRAFTPRSADETEVMMAPSTLPEFQAEVMP